ncbi:uncharacterized protein [Amphiura filiformis]|uniref:uncharacterized protein n=1 Tax=Amphiura filiformis TaxID=82378 RepID=UPI003B2179D0
MEDVTKCGFTDTSDIQEAALKTLKATNPDGRYWIKMDGTDIKSAIQQSMIGEWNGDVDMKDGELKRLREEFDKRVETLNHLKNRPTKPMLDRAKEIIKEDIDLLNCKLKAAVDLCKNLTKKKTTSEEKLKNINWEILEISTLLKKAQEIVSDYTQLKTRTNNDIKKVHAVKWDEYTRYLRDIYKKKRTPATHVLVLMVSDEERKKKPYAVPVQYVPYKSITDAEAKKIADGVKEKMVEHGLKVVGIVTDGEFSSLRTKGETRPLHIWQIIHDIRAAVNRMSKNQLQKMFARSTDSVLPDHVHDKMERLQEEGTAFKMLRPWCERTLSPQGTNITHGGIMSQKTTQNN